VKAAPLLVLLVAANAGAATPFDGVWKTRLESIRVSGKPHDFVLSAGMFSCRSCAPPYTIRADGFDQAISGHAGLDYEAVKITGPASVERTYKKGDQVTNWEALSVSTDGAKLTVHFKSFSSGQSATGVRTETRVAPGPSGSHVISGQWQPDGADAAGAGRTVTLTSTAGGLRMAWGGRVVSAEFDGRPSVIMGDPAETTVAFKRVDARTVEETDRRGGEVTDVVLWVLAADGQTIGVTDTDLQHGRTTSSTLEKQPQGSSSQGQPAESAPAVMAIAPMPLPQALAVFSKQTGLQVVYVSEAGSGVMSKGAAGGLTVREMLLRLLDGSGLTFECLNERTVRIFRIAGDEARKAGTAAEPPEGSDAKDGKAAAVCLAPGV
jgi:hypothetical protein